MATLNGFVRAANASYKRSLRANERRAREQAKQYQQNLRAQIRNENAQAADSYGDYVNMLVSLHKSCSAKINWNSFLNEPEPEKPKKTKKREEQAIASMQLYKPSFFDRMLGREAGKRAKLQSELDRAVQADLSEFNREAAKYSEDFEDWKTVKGIARGVLAADPVAYRDAISFFEPFSGISQLGSQLSCVINQRDLTINVSVNSTEIIPDYVLSVTATGKLSNKKMTVSRFNELYQDYVCSAAIRVAREVFALLPIERIQVNAIADLLDSSTGRIRPMPVLSVKFMADNLSRLDFGRIDCSDAMRNFVHRMGFSRNSGFSAVEVLEG